MRSSCYSLFAAFNFYYILCCCCCFCLYRAIKSETVLRSRQTHRITHANIARHSNKTHLRPHFRPHMTTNKIKGNNNNNSDGSRHRNTQQRHICYIEMLFRPNFVDWLHDRRCQRWRRHMHQRQQWQHHRQLRYHQVAFKLYCWRNTSILLCCFCFCFCNYICCICIRMWWLALCRIFHRSLLWLLF